MNDPYFDSDQLSYILNELGENREQYFRAVSPPIVQTSNFAFRKVKDLYKVFQDEFSDHIYSRGINPTVDILRKKLAALDNAEDALVFNSGASAIFASVFANVKSGDHILSVNDPYTWARKMFNDVLPRFNISTTYVDGSSVSNFESALQENTSVIYLESPNSWEFGLQDLEAIASMAKARNITTICDNSFCTPLYQRPIDMGIDLVLQSATKYIGGHSDVVAGVLCGSHQRIKKIFESEYLNMGNGISPFNAWLLIRGLRTLPVRLKQVDETTRNMIGFLKEQPEIESVIFPLDPSFPQYELARKQMRGACGLVTIVLKAEQHEHVVRFVESLKHILMAVSWGGYESLAMPYCAGIDPVSFDAANERHRMVRFYFGLEDADYLKHDIRQALNQLNF